jgi:hypothetical protein
LEAFAFKCPQSEREGDRVSNHPPSSNLQRKATRKKSKRTSRPHSSLRHMTEQKLLLVITIGRFHRKSGQVCRLDRFFLFNLEDWSGCLPCVAAQFRANIRTSSSLHEGAAGEKGKTYYV